jgi:hypothetical protein
VPCVGSGATDEPLSFCGAASLLLMCFDPSLAMPGTIRVVLVYTRASCDCSYVFAVVTGVILSFAGNEIKYCSLCSSGELIHSYIRGA